MSAPRHQQDADAAVLLADLEDLALVYVGVTCARLRELHAVSPDEHGGRGEMLGALMAARDALDLWTRAHAARAGMEPPAG